MAGADEMCSKSNFNIETPIKDTIRLTENYRTPDCHLDSNLEASDWKTDNLSPEHSERIRIILDGQNFYNEKIYICQGSLAVVILVSINQSDLELSLPSSHSNPFLMPPHHASSPLTQSLSWPPFFAPLDIGVDLELTAEST
ncbi:hypothetical protein RRG08_028575 [Elysia crispata]|uniref:Uncharacterized protein n=1 Tax=Elysia crispata TaxID=231223 RepID=A0AAE0YAF9_9GAST|nr:hypothetical protein RRG08_028575 [Elysia crispata]